ALAPRLPRAAAVHGQSNDAADRRRRVLQVGGADVPQHARGRPVQHDVRAWQLGPDQLGRGAAGGVRLGDGQPPRHKSEHRRYLRRQRAGDVGTTARQSRARAGTVRPFRPVRHAGASTSASTRVSPTIAMKTTTRIFGANPFQEAVSVTQHIWPAALPENAPGENDNDPDRPWALTLSSRPT